MSIHNTRTGIRTTYHGPTDSGLGSRISASGPARDSWGAKTCRVTYYWDYSLDPNENHAAAAQAWADKYLSEFSEDYKAKPVIDREGLSFGGCSFWSWSWKREDVKNV